MVPAVPVWNQDGRLFVCPTGSGVVMTTILKLREPSSDLLWRQEWPLVPVARGLNSPLSCAETKSQIVIIHSQYILLVISWELDQVKVSIPWQAFQGNGLRETLFMALNQKYACGREEIEQYSCDGSIDKTKLGHSVHLYSLWDGKLENGTSGKNRWE